MSVSRGAPRMLPHNQNIIPKPIMLQICGACNDGMLSAEKLQCVEAVGEFQSGPRCEVGRIASDQADWIIIRGYIIAFKLDLEGCITLMHHARLIHAGLLMDDGQSLNALV
jgi:hypothetical protein